MTSLMNIAPAKQMLISIIQGAQRRRSRCSIRPVAVLVLGRNTQEPKLKTYISITATNKEQAEKAEQQVFSELERRMQ